MKNADYITTSVTVEKAVALGNVLASGTYTVRLPADYDSSLVTGEDILCDDSISLVDPVSGADAMLEPCPRCGADIEDDYRRHLDDGGPGRCSDCGEPLAANRAWLRGNGYSVAEGSDG